jgi:hypothetical protein
MMMQGNAESHVVSSSKHSHHLVKAMPLETSTGLSQLSPLVLMKRLIHATASLLHLVTNVVTK